MATPPSCVVCSSTVELGAQRVEVADRAHRVDPLVGDQRDPRRVIAAVLELAEAGEQQLLGGTGADVANDAAHALEDTSG